MPIRIVEKIASDLDDISIEVDEIREESASVEAEKLEKVKSALDYAGEVIDDIRDPPTN